MSCRRLLLGLAFWVSIFVILPSAVAQPSAAEKAKQRTEAEQKVEALLREGKFADAIEPATTCVKLSRELDGAKHWRTFDAEQRLNLAEMAKGFGADKQKKLVEAMAAEEQAKKAETKPAEALKAAQAALDGYRDLLGEEVTDVARVWHLIGRIVASQLDARGSKEANDKALKIRRKILPETHPDLGKSLNNLGLVQSRLGDNKAAVESYSEAIRVWKAGLSESDPLVVMGLNNLGYVQYDVRDYEGAKKSFTEALAIRRKALPKDHLDIAASLNNLGIVQYRLREFEAAKKSHTEALAIRRKSLPKDHPDIAQSLSNLGRAQWALKEYEEAKQSDAEVLAIYRKILPKDHPDIATGLTSLGRLQNILREYEAAKKSHTEALAIYRKILPKDHPDIADSLTDLGYAHQKLRDYEGAKASHTEALAIRRKALPKDHLDIAASLNNLGIVQYRLREFEEAKKSHTEALTIKRIVLPKDHPDVAQNFHDLGIVQHELREFEEAKNSFTEAIAIRRMALSKDDPAIAASLSCLGVVQWRLRDYAAAKKSFAEALTIQRVTLPKGHPDLAQVLSNLGGVQFELRDHEAAKKNFSEALAIRRMALPKDHPDIAQSLVNLGALQQELREYKEAKQSLSEALAIHRQALSKYHPDIATSLNNLGVVQHSLRDDEGAKKSHTEALAIRIKSLPKDHPHIADSLKHLGGVQHSLRDDDGAKKSYAEALAIYRKALPADHPDIADSLNELGNLQRSLGDREGAKKSHTEALAIRRKSLPKDHPHIADSLNNLGLVQDYEESRRSHREALGIKRRSLPGDHPQIALSIINICLLDIVADNITNDSIKLLEEACAITRAELSRLAGSQSEDEQLRTTRDSRTATLMYLSAVAGSDRDAAVAYHQIAGFKGAVTARQRWTRELRDPKDATTADLLRKLALIDHELLGLSLPGQSTERTRGADDLIKRQEQLQEGRKDLEQQLSAHSEAFRVFLAKAKIGGDEIRAALPTGTCLIDFREYLHINRVTKAEGVPAGENRLIAFVVKPGGKVVLVPLGAAEPITKLVELWRATYGIGKFPAAGDPDPAAELRKALWEPLQKHLGADTTTVLVSPDGPLNGLPFAALPGSKAGTHLLHEYAFAVVPVPVLLPEMMAKKPGRPDAAGMLLMGGIDFGDAGAKPAPAGGTKLPAVPRFTHLAGTDSEVNDLRAQFEDAFPDAPAPKVLVFKKDRATKSAFLQNAPKYSYIHLATHGFFAQESEKSALDPGPPQLAVRDFRMDRVLVGRNPALLSGIVFAGVNSPDRPKEDGVLTALEAGELDLSKTELVVLSACETGRGKVAGGEGVLGLQRAFQVAGARTTVASLWKVPDEETHQLMREFYRRLWDAKKPVARAEALRQAQLWMLENANRSGLTLPEEKKGPVPPYVWAAFVLSGDWR